MPSPKHIYHATCRNAFLDLVEQAHGSDVSRLLGELAIDSAQCLIGVDLISLIDSDTKFMSSQSREYAFENGTRNLRTPVRITLCHFTQQMKDMHSQVRSGKRSLLTGS